MLKWKKNILCSYFLTLNELRIVWTWLRYFIRILLFFFLKLVSCVWSDSLVCSFDASNRCLGSSSSSSHVFSMMFMCLKLRVLHRSLTNINGTMIRSKQQRKTRFNLPTKYRKKSKIGQQWEDWSLRCWAKKIIIQRSTLYFRWFFDILPLYCSISDGSNLESIDRLAKSNKHQVSVSKNSNKLQVFSLSFGCIISKRLTIVERDDQMMFIFRKLREDKVV